MAVVISGSQGIQFGSQTYLNKAKGGGDGLTSSTPLFRSVDLSPSASSGWYWLDVGGNVSQYWIENTFNGGGWVLVATHVINVSIPGVGDSTGRTTIGAYSGSSGFVRGSVDPRSYSTWVSINTWDMIAKNNGAGRRVLYHTRSAAGGPDSSDARRSSWTWTGFQETTGEWLGENNLANEVGGSTPGFWSYHISNGYAFSTTNGSSCPGNYSNFQFWYGSCWDGSFGGGNGGGGHANAPFWQGSGGDYYNYGAIYVR